MDKNIKELKKNYEILKKKLKKNSIYTEYCKLFIEYKLKLKVEKYAFFMQVGSFYEGYAWNITEYNGEQISLYYDGYDKISYILNMLKSKKNNSIPHNYDNPYMFGFPTISKDRHIDRLLDENYHIVLISQRDDEKDSKIKIRDQVEIFNPSTNINNNDFDNFTMCITIDNYNNYYTCGISLFNLNSNENYIYECIDSKTYNNNVKNKINKIFLSYNPNKIILYNFSSFEINKLTKDLDLNLYNNLITFDDIDNKDLKKIDYQRIYLQEIYNEDILISTNINGNAFNFYNDARLSYVLLLDYIGKSNKLLLKNLTIPKYVELNEYLNLDYNTLEQLNIISQDDNYTKYSLCEILDNTSTVMGKRFLLRRLTNPLTDINELRLNYDITEKLYDDYLKFEKILSQINDISKLHKKISYQRISPNNLYSLIKNYENIKELYKLSIQYDILKEYLNKKTFEIKELDNIINDFNKIFLNRVKDINNENIEILGEIIFKKKYNVILDGYINEYNEYITKKNKILNDITEFIKKYVKGKKNSVSLKIEEGNYIVITKSKLDLFNKHKSNNEYMKDITFIQRGKNKYYLKVNELIKQYDEEMLILEKINQKQSTLYKKYLIKLGNNINYFDMIEYIVGFLDFIKSNIKMSRNNCYSKPNINEDKKSSYFDLCEFRHPIIEKINKDTEYVKNNLKLEEEYGLILTACNGLGKSSLLKNIGVCIIMAQSGLYVPCKKMTYYPFKNILTRIKGNDNIFTGSSSFQVEMIELNNIIKKSNEFSLVLMDELCRGTEQPSSHSLTIGTIEFLMKQKTKFIITTHMHSIFNDKNFIKLNNNNHLLIKHLEIDFKNGEIIYKRTLKDGLSENIYGLEIAKMLGINQDLVNRCEIIRNEYLDLSTDIVSTRKSKYNSKKYLVKCELCNKKNQSELETHHIVEQKESNEDGLIEKESYHKNELFNLMVLCKECHKKITFNKMKTSKKLLSSKGISVIKK